jgi:phage gpG-like protein
MPSLSFDMTPSAAIMFASFVALGDSLSDFREPLTESVKQVMMPSIRENFRQQGRPAWTPLSEATLARREAEGSGVSGRILSKSTRLLRRATAFKIWTVTQTEASVEGLGEDVWYGMIHQNGNERTPQREFLVMQPEDEEGIVRVFDSWVDKQLSRGGFAAV